MAQCDGLVENMVARIRMLSSKHLSCTTRTLSINIPDEFAVCTCTGLRFMFFPNACLTKH